MHQAPQVQDSSAANAAWFADNHEYVERQVVLECYRNIRRVVEHEIAGARRLLDVGNGGFFNYDTGLVGHVTAIDLFLADGPGPWPNVSLRRGSLLELPFSDGSFDCVLGQNVLHHVTGRSVRENHENLDRCLREIHRCLEPGGMALLIESTVNAAFYAFERLVFPLVRQVRVGGHPMTFQFTRRRLIEAGERQGFRLEEYTAIPRGRYVLQFGYTWPSALTPARPIKLVLRR